MKTREATTTNTGTANSAGTETSLGAPGTDGTSTETETTLGAPVPEKKTEGAKGAEGKSENAKADAGKQSEGEKGKSEAPKPIELKLPEGFAKEDALVADFTKQAQELGLDAEKAQKLFDVAAKGHAGLRDSLHDGIEAQVKEWEGALRTDKEFGGAKFVENFELAKQGLEKFGTPELKQFLYETGLGSHPEIVRAFYRAGKATAEDSSAGTGGSGAPAKSAEELMFPSMFKKEK